MKLLGEDPTASGSSGVGQERVKMGKKVSGGSPRLKRGSGNRFGKEIEPMLESVGAGSCSVTLGKKEEKVRERADAWGLAGGERRGGARPSAEGRRGRACWAGSGCETSWAAGEEAGPRPGRS